MDLSSYKEKYPSKEGRLSKIERRAKDAEILLDLQENPGVKKLCAELKTNIEAINHRLLNERITEHERDLLFMDRDRCEWFLGKFAQAEITLVNINRYLEKL